MILIPPICIRTRIMSFPQKVKAVAVFTTMRPVTHTAEVAVKKAFSKESPSPELVVKGSMRSIDPAMITARKLNRIVFAGYIDISSKKVEIFLKFSKIPVHKKKLRARIRAGGMAMKLVFPLLTIKKRLRRKNMIKRRENIKE